MRASQIEPGNADIWANIGRSRSFALQEQEAIADFERSLRLNPYDANTWLDLATAEHLAGHPEKERDAVEHALGSDPTTPSVRWRAASYFLAQGADQRAFAEIKIAAQYSVKMLPDAIHVMWNMTHDPSLVLSTLPRTETAYQQAVEYFVLHDEDVAAERAWNELSSHTADSDMKTVGPLVELLVRKKRVDAASQVWSRYCASHARSGYCESGNAITNAGFEEVLSFEGFDWHIYPVAGMNVTADSSFAYDGSRSLRLDYADSAGAEAGVYQLLPLLPHTSYKFSGVYKPDALLALNPPQLILDDPATEGPLASSPTFEGSGGWRSFVVRFNSGDTRLARLRVLRLHPEGSVHGTIWIDSLKIEAE